MVTEALYYKYLGEDFIPESQEWWGEEARSAVENKFLNHDDSVFWPNSDHPKGKCAIAALDAPEQFIGAPLKDSQSNMNSSMTIFSVLAVGHFWRRHGLF